MVTLVSPLDGGNINLATSSVNETDPANPIADLRPLLTTCSENTAENTWWSWYVQLDGTAGLASLTLDLPNDGSSGLAPFPSDWHGQRGFWSQDGGATWTMFAPTLTPATRARFVITGPITGASVLFASAPMNDVTYAGEIALKNELLAAAPSMVWPVPGADAACVYATLAATTRPSDGRVIPALQQVGYRITNMTAAPPDGRPKARVICISGQHPPEYPGRMVFHAMVRWLAKSASADAVEARRWLDVYCYPLSNPTGIYGANHRGTFEAGFVNVADPNRRWGDTGSDRPPSQVNTVASINAVLATGQPMALLDFHSPGPSEGDHALTIWRDSTRPRAVALYNLLRQADLFPNAARTATVTPVWSTTRGSATAWMHNQKGIFQAITHEVGAFGESPGSVLTTPARIVTEGEKLGLALLRMARRSMLGRTWPASYTPVAA
jgi:hypothetical protein